MRSTTVALPPPQTSSGIGQCDIDHRCDRPEIDGLLFAVFDTGNRLLLSKLWVGHVDSHVHRQCQAISQSVIYKTNSTYNSFTRNYRAIEHLCVPLISPLQVSDETEDLNGSVARARWFTALVQSSMTVIEMMRLLTGRAPAWTASTSVKSWFLPDVVEEGDYLFPLSSFSKHLLFVISDFSFSFVFLFFNCFSIFLFYFSPKNSISHLIAQAS